MAFVAATTGQDRADFVGTDALNAAPLFRNTSGNIANAENTGLFDVRRWPYLQLAAFNNTAVRTMWILVQWFDDPATLNIIGTVNYTTQQSARIVDTVPNLGPYCLVTVFWDDSATHAGSCIIMGRQVPANSGVGDGGAAGVTQAVFSRAASALAPGALIRQPAVFVQRGWATWSVYAENTGIQVGIEILDTSGVWQFYAEWFSNAPGSTWRDVRHIAVPSQMLRGYVFNQTAGNLNVGNNLIMGPTP